MRPCRLLTLTALALTAFCLVLLPPPVFARAHSAAAHRAFYAHRASYQHYRDRHSVALRHRDVAGGHRRYALRGGRDVHAFMPWQQQSGFADYQSFDGYSQTYAGRFSNRYFGGQYEQRWGGARVGESAFGQGGQFEGMAEQAASANGIPVSLVDRVIRRESGGNARAVSRGNYGLMQIRLGTARAMGYAGSAQGLLDPAVNMTYAVRYLAGAYRAAGGNESRAVALYARGYNATPRWQNAVY
jgi:soluble lytic murein transglycosylase-like protein